MDSSTEENGSDYQDTPVAWVRRAHLAIRRSLDESLAPYGLTAVQLDVLVNLWSKDGIEQRELTVLMDMKGPTLTRVVDGLVTRGLVRRREDKNDARVKRLFLTPSGKEMEAKLSDESARFRSQLFKGFSEEDLDSLRKGLLRVAENVENIDRA
ncbi:MAG: MarR family transcriptional regulator [Rubrobacteraceae bacterium]